MATGSEAFQSPEDAFKTGDTLLLQHRPAEAALCFQRVTELKPHWAEAFCKLGDALSDLQKWSRAVESYRRAIDLRPDFVAAHYNLGTALKDQGKFDEAAACFRKALELKPDFVEAHFNLGYSLRKQGNFQQALHCYHLALQGRPEWPEALTNLGDVLHELGRLDEAVTCYRTAVQRNPDLVEAYVNLGNTLLAQRKLDDAAACFARAVELKPEYANAHFHRALLMLLTSDFEHGWPEYDWRWKTGRLRAREFTQPRWEGEDLAGKTILLHAEQGFGDTIQFIRYAPLVKKLGATVIVECPKRLVKLLSSATGIDWLVGEGEQLPEFDFHSLLLSVPGIVKTTLATIPADIPYLSADPALVILWRENLPEIREFRIGINWRGRKGEGAWRQRDIPLERFVPLAQIPRTCLVSLQNAPDREERAKARDLLQIVDPGEQVDDAHGAFMDTAAIMKNLDLVITSDTSVPHLAGALGVPVWVALPSVPDWRWLLDRSDSPWYPTMRLFRQKTPGDWARVFEEMEAELRKRVAA